MSYDNTSFYGDIIASEYDDNNNFMNPESPFGYFVYKIIGGGFDQMDEMITQFMNNTSILTCDTKFINIYGRYWNLPRPTINNRLLTDEEYRVYLYLKKCRLITIQDLRINFNKCLSLDEYDIRISQVEGNKLQVVDHVSYESNDDDVISNIRARDDDVGRDKITNHFVDEDYNTVRGRTGHTYNLSVLIEIPYQGWIFIS